jgi:hypothetical protein
MPIPPTVKPLVYVSYAWNNRVPADQTGEQTMEHPDREQIVNALCAKLAEEDGISVGRDKQLVKTGDSIEAFAADIAKSQLIIAVISKKSLRSDWCMKDELLQAFRRRDCSAEEFGQDVLALILDDALPDLEDDEDLDEYWSLRAKKKRERLVRRDPDRKHNPDSWQDVDRFEELVAKLPDLIRALRIRAMPRGAEAISESDFSKIRTLVKERLQEKQGFAAAMDPLLLQSGNNGQDIDSQNINNQIHYLAIVLERAHGSSGESIEPLYNWQPYLKSPDREHYEPCSIGDKKSPAPIGEIVKATAEASVPSDVLPGLGFISLADLMQITVDWVQARRFGGSCVVELFLPLELLAFSWSTLRIKDRRSRVGQARALPAMISFVMRCWDRFSDPAFCSSLALLEQKHRLLATGEGVWLSGSAADSVDNVYAVETSETCVAIKRLHPLDEDENLRLDWLDAMQLSMVPVAIWCHHGLPARTEQEIHDYLALYGSALNGHQHGDGVACECARFEEIAIRRRSLANHPLIHDLVFLMDHPSRAPASAATASDLVSP